MLTLTIGRDTFKICHKEGARTTVWDVSKNDSEESLIQTFKDVISFVAGPEAPQTLFGAMAQAAGVPPNALRKGLPEAPPEPTNGWAAFSAALPPELPERLQSEVELIKPGEEGA